MIERDGIRLQGRSVLRAWERGALEYLLAQRRGFADVMQRLGQTGRMVHEDEVSNLVVTLGKQLVADWAVDAEGTGLTYHGIGTSTVTPALADTILGTEVTRKPWSARSRSSTSANLSVFYLASEATINIKEAGVFGGASASGTAGSGILFSHYLQSYNNSGGLYDLTFEYTVTFS
jgi:hypothetical protein